MVTSVADSGVEVLNAGLGAWVDLWAEESGDNRVDPMARAALESDLKVYISRALNAENLVVLAGLGTSLGIAPIGERKAPSMRDLWAKVEGLPEFKSITSTVRGELIKEQNIEHLLSEVQARLGLNPDHAGLTAFLAAAEQVILEACSFVGQDSLLEAHQLFLRKIARRSLRLQRTKLFTTNYDLAFEQAAVRSRFYLIDGFGLGGGGIFDGSMFDLDFVRRTSTEQMVLESNVLHLLKLHGSADWDRTGTLVRKVQGIPQNPVLIYPSANKFQLSFQQPYLEMMSRFQLALRQPDLCLMIVGFGFNDAHIVAPIEAAVRSNVSMRLIIADPAIRSEGRNPQFDWLEQLILDGDQRITLIKGTFSNLTRLLPDVAEFDDRQSHADRLSRIARSNEV